MGVFEFYINNNKVSFEDIFPGFNKQDRIGIVTHSEGGTLGISSLLMACVATYYEMFNYDDLGNQDNKLRIYPENFIFHVGDLTGNSAQLDIWPPHREVIVENDSEQILEAINDRGITRLLIEEKPETPATLMRESISSAESRIESILMFSPNGKIKNGDIEIRNNGSLSNFAVKSYDESANDLGEIRGKLIPYSKNELSNKVNIVQVYKKMI